MSTYNKYQFNVSMSCGGCSGAVKRAMTKLSQEDAGKGINIEASQFLHEQKSPDEPNVFIAIDKDADATDYETVLERIKKTGKAVNWGEKEGQRVDV
ncbi:hypothetical protein EJ05DRAFT_509334 [Pseudovirgaria hyperparasitica]|uniref:HMA domain-containing protein n=1 Tax=Pseudovirgaria hyperparasitica TaxID=470096 RepID=A0A6A6WAA5_9PEZI|nr:uncharacterized protein EJ05DRAFT_509334 [Pseudovirgaria hyperparasitica]KAF2759603.1 hypothetical protein EJ05DRAFT_509334 [Pseudovirgaria hyperparasitica]